MVGPRHRRLEPGTRNIGASDLHAPADQHPHIIPPGEAWFWGVVDAPVSTEHGFTGGEAPEQAGQLGQDGQGALPMGGDRTVRVS
jgi:hypothetical protein